MTGVYGEIIQSISKIICFDSSQKPALAGMPFGKGAADSLEYFLSLARSFGFETKNYDNYIGEVIFGEGKDFAILAHLDVVPAGSGWTHEPFGGEIDCENRRVWGRGAMDDKGPAIIALYALKALKDEGFSPKRTIKLIVGCNEESGWACIDYYNAHAVMPEEGISPDADFPVIYAEKGILQLKLKFNGKYNFTGLRGGERPNMVCDYCEVKSPEYSAKGKSAHGSTPELGVNAISPVLKFLKLDGLHTLLFEDGFDLKGMQDFTGSLTFSPNIISQTENGVEVICDIRYPATFSEDSVLEKIKAKGVEYEVVHFQKPLLNKPDSPLISTLCGVYCEVTGKNVKPVAIGGGTYARALKCGAAFGPEEDGEENTIHKADEYITFDKIERCYKIYKLAIERLCG